MKAFIHKLKKSNKIYLSLLIISLILYLGFYIWFTINLLSLSGIETLIRIIVIILFGIWFLVWLITGLITLFTKKYNTFIYMIIFTFLFTGLFGFGSYYIHSIYSEINNMSKDTITYTTNLITLNNTEFTSSSTIGIINDTTNTEGYTLAKKLIEKENLSNKLYQYDDFYVMLEDLYNHKIDACFVSGNYVVLFGGDDPFTNIASETKVIKQYSEDMKNKDNVVLTNKKLTEPFTILVMGVDSEDDGLKANQAFNGDTLMMVTFNPKTLTASMFSVPRDLWVPISCRNNALAKINSSAAYGSSCVISTMQNLTGIDIDYYVKINFKGVVDLVDALGGVTVNVEKPYFNVNAGVDYHGQVCEQNSNREFGNKVICMNPGTQKLNGEQALAYSRNRHQYIGSDLDRIRHQQDVVAAIASEAKNIRSFEDFKAILNAVQKNMDTNMTTEQILSLYNVAKSILLNAVNGNDIAISMNKTYLQTYSLPVFMGYSTTSALGYSKPSLEEITKMMRVNLELESATVNKTFSIDYNEDYTTKYYGKGLTANTDADKSVILMDNLVGKSEEVAKSWAISKGLNVNVITVYPGEENYNGSLGSGMVTNQSIHSNSVIATGNSLTLYVNGTSYINDNNTNYNNNQSNNNNNNSSDNNTTPDNSSTDNKDTKDDTKEDNNKDSETKEDNKDTKDDNTLDNTILPS